MFLILKIYNNPFVSPVKWVIKYQARILIKTIIVKKSRKESLSIRF